MHPRFPALISAMREGLHIRGHKQNAAGQGPCRRAEAALWRAAKVGGQWSCGLSKGFSLIEFIGVLAVIAIMAAAVIAVVVKRVDRAAWVKENAALSAMSDAFVQYVTRSNAIPGDGGTGTGSGWAQALASQSGIAPQDICTNSRYNARAFLVDVSGWLSTNLQPYAWVSGPGWVQTSSVTPTNPSNARFMIVSSISKNLPTNFFQLTGTRPSSSSFSNIWNTQAGTVPADSTFSTYKGAGEDLLIQRINLRPIFHRVILVDNDVGSTPYFTINGSVSATPATPSTGWNAFYIDGSVLGLGDTNAVTTVTSQEIIRKDMSRVFEHNFWRDEIDIGVHTNGATDFTTIAAIFFNSTNPPVSLDSWGPTPKGVASIFTAYMYSYAAFANTSPCFTNINTTGNQNSWSPQAKLMEDTLTYITKAQGAGTLVP